MPTIWLERCAFVCIYRLALLVISMILRRARAPFVCVMYIRLTYRDVYYRSISRMEIARTRRDALEHHRSFGRFIDDGEYHISHCSSIHSARKEKASTRFESSLFFELTIRLGRTSLSSRSRRQRSISHDEMRTAVTSLRLTFSFNETCGWHKYKRRGISWGRGDIILS